MRLSRRGWLASAALASAPSVLLAEDTKLGPIRERLSALADFVRGKRGKVSALVVDADSGEEAELDANAPLNPASNMKVVTAAAALDLLGPGYSFETGLYGSPAVEMAQAVLRGNGDPSLGEEGLWRLASTLGALGVKKVNRLLVDQSRFDEQFVPPAFEQQPNEWATFRAPVSAISLDRNTVTLNVAPEKAGAPARTWFQPGGVVAIEGQVTTKAPGGGQNIQLELQSRGSGLVAKLGGHIAEGLPRQRFAKRVEDPRALPGLALKALLQKEGVEVAEVALGGADEKSRIAFHASPPLSDLVAELGKESDNFTAETLFKALGAGATGPATWQGAADTTTRWLQSNGAFSDGMQVKNGSGLFDANRLTARALCTVLRKAYDSPRLSAEFVAQLAIGGVDGTLRSRFRELKATRRVRAKTGTLAAVDALSGYVLRDGKRPLVFSFMVNGLPGEHGAVRAKVDEIVVALAKG
jgi:serine-type D-Ala-D-Ala carboxypeptidase/endopeptidase (penicillin-binding protein 4)